MLKQINFMKNKERIQILESEISRLKVANRNNIYRIEQIESHLAEQHKGANFSKLNKPEAPECVANNIAPNEGHLREHIDNFFNRPYDAYMEAIEKKIVAEFGEDADISKKFKVMRNTYDVRNLKESTAPDYTHLLPDGYEFCSEADAEKWVKVEMKNIHDNDEFRIGSVKCVNIYKGTWLPIRPIQYKVTTHEITTAVPDPYMPDWSKAPEGTVAHAWDACGLGYWYIRRVGYTRWDGRHISSNLTLPADLDWKQSLRVKPN